MTPFLARRRVRGNAKMPEKRRGIISLQFTDSRFGNVQGIRVRPFISRYFPIMSRLPGLFRSRYIPGLR